MCKKMDEQLKPIDNVCKTVQELKEKFPKCVPVVVKGGKSIKLSPELKIKKFAVPGTLTIFQFYQKVRNLLKLQDTDCLYFTVNESTNTMMSFTFNEIYEEYKDQNGYISISYHDEDDHI